MQDYYMWNKYKNINRIFQTGNSLFDNSHIRITQILQTYRPVGLGMKITSFFFCFEIVLINIMQQIKLSPFSFFRSDILCVVFSYLFTSSESFVIPTYRAVSKKWALMIDNINPDILKGLSKQLTYSEMNKNIENTCVWMGNVLMHNRMRKLHIIENPLF